MPPEPDSSWLSPILSSALGVMLFTWLAARWKHKLAHAKSPAKQREVLQQHRRLHRVASVAAMLGLCGPLVLHIGRYLPKNDWRVVGLAAGLMALLPCLVILIGTMRGGTDAIRQGFAAYAPSQKTPAKFFYPIISAIILLGIWAAVSILS